MMLGVCQVEYKAESEGMPELAPIPGGPGGSPFQRAGLLARVGPFALVAILAEASLLLPPGRYTEPAAIISPVLLIAVALAFLLPWARLPAWAQVLVPLAYIGSALALTEAAGSTSGVGMVVLIPLIWTTLFHRPWESACVVAAIVAFMVVISVTDSASDAVIARRVLLWGALGALLAIATHGLRDRIARSQEATAQLQGRLSELRVLQVRDRLATDLQHTVVHRIFAAGMTLQGILPLAAEAEVRRRVESSVTELDDAIHLLRQVIFGLETRPDSQGLRQQVLKVCGDVSPVPEITFTGPVDSALPPESRDLLLDMLRETFGLIGTHASHASVGVEADEGLGVTVTATGPEPQVAGGDGLSRDFSPLRDKASQAGIGIEIQPVPGGTRLAWRFPVAPVGTCR
jgi:signal transduction histidine kinase